MRTRPTDTDHPVKTNPPGPDSLLYAGRPDGMPADATTLRDLNLDQILSDICDGYEEYRLEELYSEIPVSFGDVVFRLDILSDMEDPEIYGVLEAFARDLIGVKRLLKHSAGAEEDDARAKWTLDAAIRYRSVMLRLSDGCDRLQLRSEGLRRLRDWARVHNESADFFRMGDAALRCAQAFDHLRFCAAVDVGNGVVELSEDDSARDICAEFAALYRRFDLRFIERESSALADIHRSSLERRMGEVIQREHGKVFDDMRAFFDEYAGFFPEWIWRLQRETLFYISYGRFVSRLAVRGYACSRPQFAAGGFSIRGGFDAAMALQSSEVVRNDLLVGDERLIVLTGPNQGGKTTFARMLGQILYLASLGLPVPCESAELPVVTGVFTHFAVEEDGTRDSGRLQEELIRLKALTERMDRGGVIILNELFASTTAHDALQMGERVLRSLEEKGCFVLFITHLHELAALDGVVSLVAGMDDQRQQGTFVVERRTPEGRSFSHRLLDRYRLYSADIKERKHAAFHAVP